MNHTAEMPAGAPPRAFPARTVALLAIMVVLGAMAAARWNSFLAGGRVAGDASNATPEELGFFGPPSMIPQGERPRGYRRPSAPRFDLSRSLIPAEQIRGGGPPKDGIPALLEPERVTIASAELEADARVIGVEFGGEEIAYPLAVLDWHENVNDVVGEIPIAVTFCPLCDSATVFDRRVEGETLEFGISGLLHNSNVLLYDRQASPEDESLWSQVQLRAVSGPRAGQRLKTLPFEIATWETWSADHPQGEVISFNTGYRRGYRSLAYAQYRSSPDAIMFPVEPEDNRLPRRELVIGLAAGDERLAVPIDDLPAGETSVALGPHRVTLARASDSGVRIVSQPEEVQAVHTFWFAWAAMHPGTEIHRGVDGGG